MWFPCWMILPLVSAPPLSVEVFPAFSAELLWCFLDDSRGGYFHCLFYVSAFPLLVVPGGAAVHCCTEGAPRSKKREVWIEASISYFVATTAERRALCEL